MSDTNPSPFPVAMLPSAAAVCARAPIEHKVEARMVSEDAGGEGGAVAVIPVYGPIAHRRDVFMAIFGGTATTSLADVFRSMMAHPDVKAVVFDVDSPGGTVYGVSELAREIRAARGRKPIVAVANSMACSAAYWLMSGADEIVGTPSSETGSIGVYAIHVDQSGVAEKMGAKVTVISAGDLKAGASGLTPLTDDEREAMQTRVDDIYDLFVADVAKGRGVSASVVREGYGRGAVLSAQAAKDAGLIDRVATLEETVARLRSGSGRRASTRAEEGADVVAETESKVAQANGDADIRLRKARATV
jgi:signal peptide peptidase SppA